MADTKSAVDFFNELENHIRGTWNPKIPHPYGVNRDISAGFHVYAQSKEVGSDQIYVVRIDASMDAPFADTIHIVYYTVSAELLGGNGSPIIADIAFATPESSEGGSTISYQIDTSIGAEVGADGDGPSGSASVSQTTSSSFSRYIPDIAVTKRWDPAQGKVSWQWDVHDGANARDGDLDTTHLIVFRYPSTHMQGNDGTQYPPYLKLTWSIGAFDTDGYHGTRHFDDVKGSINANQLADFPVAFSPNTDRGGDFLLTTNPSQLIGLGGTPQE